MANPDITKIPAPRTPVIDPQSGDMTPTWYRFFYNLFGFTGSGSDGGVPVNRGGTGQTSYTNGQLLIGNSVANIITKNTLTPGAGIGVTNGNGTIAIANTGVLSVSGGTTGLTPATATTGAVVLAGTLNVANGGTGATTAAGARTNLGAAASGANSDITSLSGLTTPLSITQGGTDASTAAGARTNLGLGGGLSVTITTAKLTALGANGSMTFVNGILTAQTQAT